MPGFQHTGSLFPTWKIVIFIIFKGKKIGKLLFSLFLKENNIGKFSQTYDQLSLWNCHWEEFLPFALKDFRVNCRFKCMRLTTEHRELWTGVSRYLVNKVRNNVTEIANECQSHHVIVIHQMPITSQWMASRCLQPPTHRLGLAGSSSQMAITQDINWLL